MRWTSLFGGMALLLAAIVGCKQPIINTLADYDHYKTIMPVPNLDNDPNAGSVPVIPPCPTPATVLDPERPPRMISLAEAIAKSLECGTIGRTDLTRSLILSAQGLQASQDPVLNDTTVSFTGAAGINGSALAGPDAIRVLRLDPAIFGSNIDLALSRFDLIWNTSMNWNTTDQPVGTPLQTFQAGGQAGVAAVVQEQATLSSALVKPLPTGGIAGITFNVPYTQTNLPARVNPAYQPQLQFSFEQPLLRGYGIEINQVAQSHPGSILNLVPFFQGAVNPLAPSNESILVSRIRFDQSRADFERQLNFMVLNVEIVYWNLYYSYWELYAAEQGLRQAFETWKISRASYESGRIGIGDLAQARGQYEQFRAQRLSAVSDVMELERQLRGMIGLPLEDGCRLIPNDQPTLAPFRPDWDVSLNEAMASFPDLALARDDVKANQMNVVALKNQLLPDLRVTAQYDANSIGTGLSGPGPTNALRQLSSDHFNDWSIGLRLIVPVGFRAAHSNLRAAQVRLARSFEVLRNVEQRVERTLGLQYRRIASSYELIKIQRSQREAYAEQLRARFQQFLAGQQQVTLDRLLESQRFWATALQSEYAAIRDYNNAIVSFEASKGTNLARNNIIINEAMLPVNAQKRAAEHERQREHALPIRERALPQLAPVPIQDAPVQLQVNNAPDKVPSLAALWEKDPPLQEAPSLPPLYAISGPSAIQQITATSSESVTRPVVPAAATSPAGISTSGAARVGPPTPSGTAPTSTPASNMGSAIDQGVSRPRSSSPYAPGSDLPVLLAPPPSLSTSPSSKVP